MPGFEPFDVVTLPLPFTGHDESAVRSALIAMITAAKRSAWPFNAAITDLASAGLKLPCVVRTKRNAADLTLIDRKGG